MQAWLYGVLTNLRDHRGEPPYPLFNAPGEPPMTHEDMQRMRMRAVRLRAARLSGQPSEERDARALLPHRFTCTFHSTADPLPITVLNLACKLAPGVFMGW